MRIFFADKLLGKRPTPMNLKSLFATAIMFAAVSVTRAADHAAFPTTQPNQTIPVGERVPSDDPVLKDFHSLGLVNGRVNLFRCASPVRDLGSSTGTAPTSDEMTIAQSRIQRLSDLGIRTIVCLEDPADPETDNPAAAAAKITQLKSRLALEKSAAEKAGLQFVLMPMANAGPNSLQTMSDAQVLDWLVHVRAEIFKAEQSGGVVFHCSAGHDRTGLVTAFIRMKDQHWPVDQAIDEMRRFGHNWVKYSNNGGISSWHEDHLRAIAKMFASPTVGLSPDPHN